MTHTTDAVVVGTGIIGAAVAYELALTGLRVVVVDRLGDVGSAANTTNLRLAPRTMPGPGGKPDSWCYRVELPLLTHLHFAIGRCRPLRQISAISAKLAFSRGPAKSRNARIFNGISDRPV